MSRLRAFARVLKGHRWREIGDTALAQVALLRAQLLIWTRPRGRLLGTERGAVEASASQVGEVEVGARLATAIERATRYGVFSPQCLTRALALKSMLEANGVRGSTVRIGVRWAAGEFVAHAWVEHGGVILGDTAANTASFVPLPDVQLSSGSGTEKRRDPAG